MFEQQVLRGSQPPYYDKICAAFPVAAGLGVIFSWGDKVYIPKPKGENWSDALRAHEAVHGERQVKIGVEPWWDLYIANAEFRLQEEIPAHIAEYVEFYRNEKSRNYRRTMLHSIASRLASPLYGRLIRYDQARTLMSKALVAAGLKS